MTPRDRGARSREAGFVLIGVVIFVLALTIIGMSLYSLSSYEAQFLQRSIDREQAFQSALGGLERAKFVLTAATPPPPRLDRVWQDLPRDNVITATAIQVQGGVPDSSGPVDWHGSDVTLRVTALVNGERRTLEGRFVPRLTRDVYSQLIATSGGISVEALAGAGSVQTDRRYTVHLTGPLWEGLSPTDTLTWLPRLGSPLPVGISTDPVELPATAQYLASHSGSGIADPVLRQYMYPNPGVPTWWWRYRFNAGAGNVGLFGAPTGGVPSDPDFSLYDRQTHYGTMLRVKGCAIWLMPRGVRFDGKVTVLGLSPSPGSDCLLIVAGRSGTFHDDPDAGIWFFAGLESSIPVILISDGRVYLQHLNNPAGENSSVGDLTIYARDVVLTGPERSSGRRMDLAHLTSGYLDSYWVPLLANSGYLPNVTSASGRELALRPGTWRAYP